MALPTSRLSYEDCFKVLEQALESPRGVRIKMANEGAAKKFRSRLHYARVIDRNDNRDNFSLDHPMYGRSTYDQIVTEFRYEGSFVWIYLTNQSSAIHIIEEIPDEHEATNGDNGEVEGEGPNEGTSEEAALKEGSEVLHASVPIRRI